MAIVNPATLQGLGMALSSMASGLSGNPGYMQGASGMMGDMQRMQLLNAQLQAIRDAEEEKKRKRLAVGNYTEAMANPLQLGIASQPVEVQGPLPAGIAEAARPTINKDFFSPERMRAGLANAQSELLAADPDLALKAISTNLLTPTDPWKNFKEVGQNLYRMGPSGVPELAGSGGASPSTKQAFDSVTKTLRFVTEKDIADNPQRFTPVPSGMKIESDGQGGFTMVTGDMAATGGTEGLTNKTRGELQGSAIASKEGLARLASISTSFRPEYQQIGTRWDAFKTSLADKAGVPVDRQSAALLRDFSSYKADALNNLNLYIKEITGAAMTNAEAGRITKGLPNPGSGILDGDSPIEFKAKLDSTMVRLKAANARQFYALKHGLTPEAMFATPLESMPDIIDKRGVDIEAEIRAQNPTMPPEQIQAVVDERLKQEFGL